MNATVKWGNFEQWGNIEQNSVKNFHYKCNFVRHRYGWYPNKIITATRLPQEDISRLH